MKAEFKRNPEAFWAPGLLSLRWDWLISPKDTVDLTGAFLIDHPGLEGIIQFIFGYAACYVKSETERDAVLTIGSDDGYKIWLNGDMIGKLRTYRGCKPDENRIPVRLKAGWNRLLVKIEQETGGYEFALRFLDPAGKPLVLETSLTPPVPVAADSSATGCCSGRSRMPGNGRSASVSKPLSSKTRRERFRMPGHTRLNFRLTKRRTTSPELS